MKASYCLLPLCQELKEAEFSAVLLSTLFPVGESSLTATLLALEKANVVQDAEQAQGS